MQLISNLFAFELFKRKINATDIQFEHSEIIQIPVSSWYFPSKQNRSLRFPLFSPALASISLTYDCPQPIPLLLMPRPMLFFLCCSSLCSLALQPPALPGPPMQPPLGPRPTGRTPPSSSRRCTLEPCRPSHFPLL